MEPDRYNLRYPRNGSISELAASIASKLARNAAVPGDPPQAGATVLSKGSFTLESERRDEISASQQVASEMAHRDPPRTNRASNEYRERAEACLNWAREASTDEVRLACLTLANAWLKAAMGEDDGGSDHSPLAPRL
jgi:hypothetical protein